MNLIEAAQMALDALEYPGPSWPDARQKAAEALRVALAQIEREWVGLTDEEMFTALLDADPIAKRLPLGFEIFARAIEAKLKEKNS
jgi:hypothetical protein